MNSYEDKSQESEWFAGDESEGFAGDYFLKKDSCHEFYDYCMSFLHMRFDIKCQNFIPKKDPWIEQEQDCLVSFKINF